MPGHTHPEKENSDGQSLKSSASLALVMKSETPKAEKRNTIYSTDPLTAILASLDHFMGYMELRAGTVGFRIPSLPIFLTVSTTENLKRR